MQGESVGAIYYEVAADTSKLTTAEKAVADSMQKVEKSTKGADSAVDKLSVKKTKLATAMDSVTASANKQRNAFSGLQGVIAAYLSMRTLQWVANLSDQYQQNASRIKNATQSSEEYAMVQERLLQTANGTYRSLGEAQEVYLAVGETLRGLKFNLSEVLDITDSFSYALVRDAARADQATTAMDAWSKAIQKGKIEADAWASIMAATPSIVEGISEATGKSANEIRKLGANGKLSLEAMNEGLLRSKERNKELAEQMSVSTKDAVTQLTNSFTVFFGKVNEASKASNVFTDNVTAMANLLQDPEVINAGVAFANGIVTAMNKIITGAKNTVEFVRWMGEEIAIAMNGGKPTFDDQNRAGGYIDREQKRIDQLQKSYDTFAKLPKFLQGDQDKLKQTIDDAQKALNTYKELNRESAKTPTVKEPPKTEPPKTDYSGRRRVSAVAADDKKDKSGENAAKKAAAEEKARAKAAKSYIEQMENQLDKANKISAVETLLRDITEERVILKGKEMETALQLAQAIDDQAEAEQAREDALNRENELLTTQRQLQAEILGYSLKLAGSIMGSGARQEMEERAQMLETFATRERQLQDQRRAELSKATADEKERINKQYDEALKIERDYQSKSLVEYDKYIAKKKELDADWRVGALRAIAEYQEAAANMADQSAAAFTNAMSSMEDALVNFAKTGKLNFTDLANSIISDIARMAAKSATSGIMNLVTSLIGNYFGTPSTSIGSGSSSSVGSVGNISYSLGSGSSGLGMKISGGRASGGPVAAGNMYRVNEKGSPELLDVGGNQYLMMGKQSGKVTASSSGAGVAGAGGGVQVNIYNSSGSEVTTSQRQGDSGSIIDVIVKRAVDATANSIASGGVVGKSIQSTFALNRGAGTTRYGR